MAGYAYVKMEKDNKALLSFLNLNGEKSIFAKDMIMNLLKKTAMSIVVAASVLTFSANTFAAEEHKDLNATVLKAAKDTEANLLAAKALLEKGGYTHDEILNNLNEARQNVKEFRYEQTERLRQKLNDRLKQAREAFLDKNNEKTLADVNEALKIYADMRKIYDAAH